MCFVLFACKLFLRYVVWCVLLFDAFYDGFAFVCDDALLFGCLVCLVVVIGFGLCLLCCFGLNTICLGGLVVVLFWYLCGLRCCFDFVLSYLVYLIIVLFAL